MSALLTAIHIIICIILILAVILQSGKAADLAGAFGGAGSQTVFGPRGAGTLLSRVTTACAVLFMFTSLGLWILSAKGGKSVIKGVETPKEEAVQTETQREIPAESKAQPAQQEEQK
ncbi:MAG: preprotein translocase subunit SecG [Candidatus Aminicenantia bacterium]